MWDEIDLWITATGALCAMACALPGTFLLLRGMSMMGDAISHAVLPGLAIAFLVSGDRTSIAMFAGAALAGIFTALFTQWVSRFGNVDRGAAMGIVFTTLFALGLLLIRRAADQVDLDPGCVLYGNLEFTFLDRVGGVPRAALVLAVVLLVNLGFVGLLYKELKLSSFDPELASTLGFPAGLLHYLLMTSVAITTVAAFEAVGSIIVIAMLIVPPASAFLLTHRLPRLLALALGFALGSAVLGHWLATEVPGWFGYGSTSSSGMMAVAAGILFTLAWIAAPRDGLVARWLRRSRPGPTADPSSPG